VQLVGAHICVDDLLASCIEPLYRHPSSFTHFTGQLPHSSNIHTTQMYPQQDIHLAFLITAAATAAAAVAAAAPCALLLLLLLLLLAQDTHPV
jgi:hypothetical protein